LGVLALIPVLFLALPLVLVPFFLLFWRIIRRGRLDYHEHGLHHPYQNIEIAFCDVYALIWNTGSRRLYVEAYEGESKRYIEYICGGLNHLVDLELRDRLSEAIIARWWRRWQSGRSIRWTSQLRFFATDLEVTPSEFGGTGEPDRVRYEDVTFVVYANYLELRFANGPLRRLEQSTDVFDFYPGLVVLQRIQEHLNTLRNENGASALDADAPNANTERRFFPKHD